LAPNHISGFDNVWVYTAVITISSDKIDNETHKASGWVSAALAFIERCGLDPDALGIQDLIDAADAFAFCSHRSADSGVLARLARGLPPRNYPARHRSMVLPKLRVIIKSAKLTLQSEDPDLDEVKQILSNPLLGSLPTWRGAATDWIQLESTTDYIETSLQSGVDTGTVEAFLSCPERILTALEKETFRQTESAIRGIGVTMTRAFAAVLDAVVDGSDNTAFLVPFSSAEMNGRDIYEWIGSSAVEYLRVGMCYNGAVP